MSRLFLLLALVLLASCTQINDMTKAIRGIRPYDSSKLQGEWFAVTSTRMVYAGTDQKSGTVTWKKENSFTVDKSSDFLRFQSDTLIRRKGHTIDRPNMNVIPLKTFRYVTLEQYKKGVFAKRLLSNGEEKQVQLASALYVNGDTLIMEKISHQSKKGDPKPQFQLDRTCFLRTPMK